MAPLASNAPPPYGTYPEVQAKELLEYPWPSGTVMVTGPGSVTFEPPPAPKPVKKGASSQITMEVAVHAKPEGLRHMLAVEAGELLSEVLLAGATSTRFSVEYNRDVMTAAIEVRVTEL